MSKNNNLCKARKEKNDEFYTLYEDIENEIINYKEQLKDKIIYCNCDKADFSNFYFYFKNNFNNLNLKKVIFTNYEENKTESIKTEITKNGIIQKIINGNGDFRSDECISILKESDIVITNPPFSLFREFIQLFINNNKDFLVIGSLNCVSTKQLFPYFKDNKIFIGLNNLKFFINKEKDLIEFGNINWFTSLKTNNKKSIIFNKENKEYEKYDNYDAINIDKIKDIPDDYYEEMGVPITFMLYNQDEFDIIGLDYYLTKEKNGKLSRFFINNKEKYARIIIKRRM